MMLPPPTPASALAAPIPWSHTALRHFRVTPVQVLLRVSAPWRGPAFKGMLLRSALGYHLRERECLTGAASCVGCPSQAECWYAMAFDTPAAAIPRPSAHGDEALPHPYFLATAPHFGSHLAPGEYLPCLLTLFGEPEPLLYKLLTALELAGASGRWGGRFHLAVVRSALQPTIEGIPRLGWAPNVRSGWPRWEPPEPRPVDSIRLSFLSPLRLRVEGHVQRQPSFPLLGRALLRRLHLLIRFYSAVDLPKGWMAQLQREANTAIAGESDWTYVREERTSGRQQRRIAFDGVLGGAELAGDFAGLWPFLELGQWTGVGSSTSHGFGCYSLQELVAGADQTPA